MLSDKPYKNIYGQYGVGCFIFILVHFSDIFNTMSLISISEIILLHSIKKNLSYGEIFLYVKYSFFILLQYSFIFLLFRYHWLNNTSFVLISFRKSFLVIFLFSAFLLVALSFTILMHYYNKLYQLHIHCT